MSNPEPAIVYFGGLDILSGISKELSERETDYEHFAEAFSKATEELRTQIIDMLNQHAEVKDIKSLFKEMPALLKMNRFIPIVFKFRLPLSLQSSRKIKLISEIWTFEAEEFQVVYDGVLLMIAAPCSAQERPTGIVDVRDRFIDMLNTIASPRRIAPCITHHGIVLTRSKETEPETKDVYLQIKKKTSFINVIRELYWTICYPMTTFYNTCKISDKIEELKIKMAQTEENLFKSLRRLEACRWKDYFEKRRILKEIRTNVLQILEKMAEYPALMQELQKSLDYVRDQMRKEKIFREFMEKNNWLEYADTEPLNTETFTRTVEYAHREVETHSITASETRAALIGGLIGTIATLLLSYLLGPSVSPANASPNNNTIAQTIHTLVTLFI